MLVSEAVANAKADVGRLSVEIDDWAEDFVELLGAVTHLDLVFTETAGMQPAYIALCDWDDPSQLLIVQTIPLAASEHQLKMARALVSVITSVLFRLGHSDVAVALIDETSGRLFHHEAIGAYCKLIAGCPRIPEGKSQFNFSVIPGHICRSALPVVLN